MIRILLFCFISIWSFIAVAQDSTLKTVIYLYGDTGAAPESITQTQHLVKELLPNYAVKVVNAEEIIENKWSQEAAVLIMPGGADLFYVQKLNGPGNQAIKKYVEEGGAYLGICAGAYYGSSYVEFDKGGPLQVLGKRELAFFPGKSSGPILAPYDYLSSSGVRAAHLTVAEEAVKEVTVYYNGGGYFADVEKYKNTSVVGFYDNGLPAIIHIPVGKGNVILSGVHFEYDPALLNFKDKDLMKIYPLLSQWDEARKSLAQEIFKKLGLTV